jgi:16S rRNA (guanine527-N7)-methyltransferase
MPRPQPTRSSTSATLGPVLEEARQLGFLGPGPVEAHIQHSLAFSAAFCQRPGATRGPAAGPLATTAGAAELVAADLGSGGGVPALVLLYLWPSSHWYLVESNQRRSAWLKDAVAALGASARCDVMAIRAEELGRSRLRGSCDLVTARGFATPGPTAECAAPLLRPGGTLAVSGPPDDGAQRWPADELATLGMEYCLTYAELLAEVPATITLITQLSPAPPRYPRRTGIPFKRPLF